MLGTPRHAQRCLNGGDRAKLHDVGCHIFHNACCEAVLKGQREIIRPDARDGEARGTTGRRGCGGTQGCQTSASTWKLPITPLLCRKDKRRLRLQYKQNGRNRASTDERDEEWGSLASSLCSSAGGLAQDSTRPSANSLVTSEQSAWRLAETEADHANTTHSARHEFLAHWRAQYRSDSDVSSCWRHHEDLLVLDGRCQDESFTVWIPGWVGAGECHFSADQAQCNSMSLGTWGHVLPAHVREGFTRFH